MPLITTLNNLHDEVGYAEITMSDSISAFLSGVSKNVMSYSKWNLFRKGWIDTLPLVVAAAPFGVLYGALAIDNGLSLWSVLGMSLLVYAGASQFIAVTLLASATALPIICLTVFIVNLRHMLYAATLMPHVRDISLPRRTLMAFWLTDETFAVVSQRLQSEVQRGELVWYYLGSALFMYSNWALCTLVGVTVGKQLPNMTSWGLDVAMVVAFISIVVPALKKFPQWACAAVAVVCSILMRDWPNQSGLMISSLLAVVTGMVLEKGMKK